MNITEKEKREFDKLICNLDRDALLWILDRVQHELKLLWDVESEWNE